MVSLQMGAFRGGILLPRFSFFTTYGDLGILISHIGNNVVENEECIIFIIVVSIDSRIIHDRQ